MCHSQFLLLPLNTSRQMPDQQPLKIFIVYAREDTDALKELRVQFIPVTRSENLVVWYDGEILPGQHWDKEIKTQLQSADIILLFISKYFFASEYIQTTELKEALARHEAGKSVVVPVIVRPCVWQDAFDVSRFQALPTGAQPIFSKYWHDQDEAMVTVIEGVKKVVKRLRDDRRSKDEHLERERIGEQVRKEKEAADRFDYEQREKAVQNPADQNKMKALGIEMIFVKGGFFHLGEKKSINPTPIVKIPDFELSNHLLTQKLWLEVMGTSPSFFKKCQECPVENVSWNDVQVFFKRLNSQFSDKHFRLPTESEWEYAAQGGNLSHNFIYAGSNDPDEVAWTKENSGDEKLPGEHYEPSVRRNNCRTHPVGLKKANELGLFDLSGNVCEWCEDDWSDDYKKTPNDGTPYISAGKRGRTRIVHGGSWYGIHSGAKIFHRNGYFVNEPSPYVGFRLACNHTS